MHTHELFMLYLIKATNEVCWPRFSQTAFRMQAEIQACAGNGGRSSSATSTYTVSRYAKLRQQAAPATSTMFQGVSVWICGK